MTRLERANQYRIHLNNEWEQKLDKVSSNLTMAEIMSHPSIESDNSKRQPMSSIITMADIMALPVIDCQLSSEWVFFNEEKNTHVTEACRKYLAAYRIQQWWHRIRLDPRHPVGIRRLEREYTELFGPDAP